MKQSPKSQRRKPKYSFFKKTRYQTKDLKGHSDKYLITIKDEESLRQVIKFLNTPTSKQEDETFRENPLYFEVGGWIVHIYLDSLQTKVVGLLVAEETSYQGDNEIKMLITLALMALEDRQIKDFSRISLKLSTQYNIRISHLWKAINSPRSITKQFHSFLFDYSSAQ